ncbi:MULTISPECIES: hypothetical protein [unclassified Cupriavidus]|uniref:hypothetical protein n=1 Tax=unclassified Cupriavidus TaxID=2640874 RepID=UPI00313EA897
MNQNSINRGEPKEGRAKSLLNDLLSSIATQPQDRHMFTALFVEGRATGEVRKEMNLSEEEFREQQLAMMRRFRTGKTIAA